MFVRNRGYEPIERITVIADQGSFDPLEVAADSVARGHGATIGFIATLAEDTSDEQVGAAREYLNTLTGFCWADGEVTVARSADLVEDLADLN